MDDIDGLDRFVLLHEPFILLLPVTRRGKDNGNLARLAAELPFIWYTDRSHMAHQIGLHLRRLRLDLPRGQAYELTSGIVSMVAAGLGWAITTPLCMLDARPPAEQGLLRAATAASDISPNRARGAQRRDGKHTVPNRRFRAEGSRDALCPGNRRNVPLVGQQVQNRRNVAEMRGMPTGLFRSCCSDRALALLVNMCLDRIAVPFDEPDDTLLRLLRVRSRRVAYRVHAFLVSLHQHLVLVVGCGPDAAPAPPDRSRAPLRRRDAPAISW